MAKLPTREAGLLFKPDSHGDMIASGYSLKKYERPREKYAYTAMG